MIRWGDITVWLAPDESTGAVSVRRGGRAGIRDYPMDSVRARHWLGQFRASGYQVERTFYGWEVRRVVVG